MRIACPACNAAYDVPDGELRNDRVVRCARCGTDWAPVVPIPAASSERKPDKEALPSAEAMFAGVALDPEPEPRQMALDDDVPFPSPVAPAPAPPPPAARRRLPLLTIAWVLSVLLVIGAVAALGVKREKVMALWPPSTRLYAALGLAARP